MLQYMEKFTVDDTFELKNQKMCTKEKYYNVLQQPSALLEKIFYVLTQFLVWFFSQLFHSKYGTLCKSMNYKRETRYWKRKCNKTWLINRKFLLFLYFFSENLAKYYIFFWHLPRLIMRERDKLLFFCKIVFLQYVVVQFWVKDFSEIKRI